jgi:(R,R)-butanediol dehydrogenase / meso-butanediol dehydrogenase / diacetyl reductase
VRAVVIQPDRSLAVEEVDEPTPGPGQVRIRVEACGICGSDLHMRPSEGVLPAGTIMGHEFSGVVDAVGGDVDAWAPGDRVCVFPGRPLDRHDIVAQLGAGVGLGPLPGAYAEAVVVDADTLWRLPDDLPLEHGALVEPLAVALHGLDVGGVEAGEAVAVLGAGPIGIMVLVALRARGVDRVVAVEPNEERRALAAELAAHTTGLDGVHAAVLDALGEAPARVFECAGHPSALPLATELVASSGVIALLGVLEEPVEISQMNLMVKEAQVRASFAYRPGNFDEAIDLLLAGRVPAERLITAREPLERAEAMFAELLRPGTEQVKVLLKPSEQPG